MPTPFISCVSYSVQQRRASVRVSCFISPTGSPPMRESPRSLVIGGPIGGFILDTFDGSIGLGGWQWLFIIEGVPSILVGLWALKHLTDKPIEAAWLDPDERVALQARIDHERKSREAIRHYRLGEALTNPRVLGL